MTAPPLSVTGVWQSLRWPTARDVVFSLKAYLAIVLCLLIGFSQNLINPYWSALTVYIVLMQPESGAIRSKSLYRLIGTIGGGLLIIAMTGIFGDHLGVLLVLNIVVITLSTWARGVDRTPTNYIWFSGGLTAGFIGLVDLQTPGQIFALSTARMAEISVGIVVMAAIDSLIWPKHMLPDFLDTMDEWRGRAREWVTDSLDRTSGCAPDAERRHAVREKLRKLTETIGVIDAKAVQIPYDTVAAPPRRRDVHLLRRTVMRLITDLAAIEDWARAMRRTDAGAGGIGEEIDAVVAWVEHGGEDGLFVDLAAVEPLTQAIEAARIERQGRTDRRALVEQGMLNRLDTFVGDWADFAQTMRAVRSRHQLPPRLRAIARDATPVRSIDFIAATRDVLPMPVAMGVAATLYYLLAWSSGAYALLFAFIGCAFLIGQPQTLRSGAGVVTWVSIAFVAVFAYQFTILPRVTAFPVLVAVLLPFLFLVGLLLSMSLAGLFIAVFFFAFLSLQNTYTGDFESALLSLGGSMAGLLFAITSLYVLSYDKPRFTARRLVRALRGDIADAAARPNVASRERFLQLTIDRLAQFFPAIDSIGDDDPLAQVDMIDDLMIGLGVIRLRGLRDTVPADIAGSLDALLHDLGEAFAHHPAGGELPDSLLVDIDALIERAATIDDVRDAAAFATALMGLRLRLASDGAPFGMAARDEGEDAPAADADDHEDVKGPSDQ